jgi:hypothetical protein
MTSEPTGCCVGCGGLRSPKAAVPKSTPVLFPQFWSAYVPCQTQDRDAVRLTLEQIDLIHRICTTYPELELVTSVDGRWTDEGC